MPKAGTFKISETLSQRLERGAIPEPNSGCILWLRKVDPSGYGRVRHRPTSPIPLYVHRAAWEVANGPIPAGMCVCHKCDVRTCINPQHMFLGTLIENIADMDAKGRRGKPFSRNPKVEN